jgi:hypothetical protein
MLVLEPIDDLRAEALSRQSQIFGVLLADSTNAFVHHLAAQPRTPLDVISRLGPAIAQREAQGIDAVLVMAGGFLDLVPACPQWDHAELQGGVVGMLEPTVDAQSRRPRITEVTIDDLE